MIIKKGTSILEVVIATAMITMAVISALALTSKSESQNTYARHSAQASKYASEAADWLRGERDNQGFSTLASVSGSYCISTLPVDFLSLGAPTVCGDQNLINNIFKRTLILDNSSSDRVRASVVVSWQEKTLRTTTIDLELTKW